MVDVGINRMDEEQRTASAVAWEMEYMSNKVVVNALVAIRSKAPLVVPRVITFDR